MTAFLAGGVCSRGSTSTTRAVALAAVQVKSLRAAYAIA
jgi:hypothetical protein